MKKKILLILLSFFIPFFFLIMIFHMNGFFSNKTIITGDMYAQYYPLFNYLKELLNGNESIFYSMNKAIGGTMFGTFFYYLSSPFNLIVALFSNKAIPTIMTILIIIKISLCGLTMYIYMSKKHNTNNLLILVFSLCYALMGYNINYFINIMWLDVVIITPLVLLGIDKIIEGKKPTTYILFLTLSIITNYYISYMLCIFCVIYFIYEISIKYNLKRDKKELKKTTKTFLICSFLSGLICSFFLIPCFIEMMNYGRSTTIDEIIKFDYNFFDIFSKTYIGSLNLSNTLNYSSMNIYCGIAILPLVYLYLINKKIAKKNRRNTLFLIAFMILPCFIYPLNYVWHLFTVPSFYSYRYSFLLCFILINIAYKSYINLEISLKKVLLFLALYLIISFYFIIISYFSKYYEFLNYKLIWLTLIILGITFLVLFIKNEKRRSLIITALLLTDIFLNVHIIFKNTEKYPIDIIETGIIENVINKYYEKERIEFKNYSLTDNDSVLLGYRGINNFLSTTNYRTINLLKALNFKFKIKSNIYALENESYILDALMGIKIIATPNIIEEYKLLETIEDTSLSYVQKLNIYENPNSLSLGYIIKNKCNDIDNNLFYDQEALNCILNENHSYYKEYDVDNDNRTIEITNKGYYYLYLDDIINKDIIQENDLKNLEYYDENYLLFYNEAKEKTIQLKTNDIDIQKLKAYYLDLNILNKSIEKLKKEQLDYKIDKNKIYGSITTEGGILMLTIPYEKGFIIKVDGTQVEYEEVLNSLIGIELEKGTHEITVEYKQPGLKLGIIISFIAILTAIIYTRSKNEEHN